MGLKNKHSLFDLVKGTDPVGKMETEPIKPFQPSTTEASNKHIESLQKVPGPPQNSPHQDLNGAPGPQFQLPTAQASQKHINSLQQVPGGTENSQHQDLNGVPDPNYNTYNGTKDSPFSSGDHMIDLLTQKIQSTNTNQTYEPSPNQSPHQDLDGELGPQSQLPTAQASQKHIDSLQSVPGGDSNSPFQDLDGVPGPQFQLPTGDASQAHIDSLQQVPGPPQNSPHQDLDGNPGPTFDLGDTSTLQQNSLLSVPGGDSNSPFQDLNGNAGPKFDTGKPTQVHADPNQKTPTELVANYTSTVNPDANYGNSQWPVVPAVNQDLDGINGPGFSKGETSKLQQDSLANIYQSTINPDASYGAGQPKGTWPSVNPSTLDLNGKDGQLFDMGRGSILKQDLLANIYQSAINPKASYGAGQPGVTWPSVNPSPLLPAGYADLDGIKPTGYQNPDTGVQY
jgi:hypothetical protein